MDNRLLDVMKYDYAMLSKENTRILVRVFILPQSIKVVLFSNSSSFDYDERYGGTYFNYPYKLGFWYRDPSDMNFTRSWNMTLNTNLYDMIKNT